MTELTFYNDTSVQVNHWIEVVGLMTEPGECKLSMKYL
jgi:hypothetical protein